MSVADPPTVVANSLPTGTVRQMAPQVIEWVWRNKDAVLDDARPPLPCLSNEALLSSQSAVLNNKQGRTQQ